MSDRKLTVSEPELRALQAEARSEGRCGSLQTFSGLPCKRWPKAGYTVCIKHGERAPQTVQKAERVLAAARIPAIAFLLDSVEQYMAEECQECGFPKGSLKERKFMLSMVTKILDRTGLGPRATLDIRALQGDTDLDVENLTDDEGAALAGLLQGLRELKARVAARRAAEGDALAPRADVVPGVVVAGGRAAGLLPGAEEPS